jgi:hypothetical protein
MNIVTRSAPWQPVQHVNTRVRQYGYLLKLAASGWSAGGLPVVRRGSRSYASWQLARAAEGVGELELAFEVIVVVGLAGNIWFFRPTGRGSDGELDQALRSMISPVSCGLWLLISLWVLGQPHRTHLEEILVAGPWLLLGVYSTMQRLRRSRGPARDVVDDLSAPR